MHTLWVLALIFGALALLVFGLVGVVHDLLERGPYEPPLIRNDGLAWPARYRGSSGSSLQPARSETRFAGATWSERGSSQH
jgi:hypothetical protein